MTLGCDKRMLTDRGGVILRAGSKQGTAMTELVNGHITVRIGLGEVAAAPRQTAPRSRRPSQSELRARVVRLRRDGLSYRRIAATLRMPYGDVAVILDGPAIWVGDWRDRAAPIASVAAPPSPPAAATAELRQTNQLQTPAAGGRDPAEAVLRHQARLSEKVAALLRTAEHQGRALTRLEGSILAAMRGENARLADRILTGVKALFERLLPLIPQRDHGRSGK